MNRCTIVCLVVFALVACVAAQYGGGYGGGYYPQPHYETREKKFISIPIPHLRINLDKLTLPIPNLMSLFSSHSSSHHDDDDDEYDHHY